MRTIDGLFDSAFLTLIEKMLQVESHCDIFAAHTLVIAVGYAPDLLWPSIKMTNF